MGILNREDRDTLYDAQALGLPHHSGTDLLAYWHERDPFFLAD